MNFFIHPSIHYYTTETSTGFKNLKTDNEINCMNLVKTLIKQRWRVQFHLLYGSKIFKGSSPPPVNFTPLSPRM